MILFSGLPEEEGTNEDKVVRGILDRRREETEEEGEEGDILDIMIE